MIRGLLLCVLIVPAGADTVFLNNGTAIDGLIKARHEQTIELQIGKIGRIFVELDVIESIEKNDRDGSESDAGIVLTGTRRLVEEAPVVAGADGQKPVEQTQERPKDRRYRTKEDVEPEMRAEIERQIYDFTREKRKFRVRATQRIAEIGEPALPFLLDIVNHENPQVRISVMEIFTQHGNDLVIKETMDRLEDENEYVRKTANEALVKITGKDLGFVHDSSAATRQTSLDAWRAWYKELKDQEAAEAAEAAKEKEQKPADASAPKEDDPAVIKDLPAKSAEPPADPSEGEEEAGPPEK